MFVRESVSVCGVCVCVCEVMLKRRQKGRSTVCMCSSSQAQTNVKKWGEGNYVIMVVAEGGRGVGKRREESLSL